MPLAKGINLLITKKGVSVGKTRTIRLARVGSIVLLIFYCLVVIGIFSYWFYLQKEEKRVKQEINFSKRKIRELEKTESLQLVLKGRLSTLKKILEQKEPDYKVLLGYFDQFSSQGVSLENITLSGDGKINFSGRADNVLSLANFLERIAEERTLFSRAILTSVVRAEDGSYNVGLDMEANQ